MNEHEKAALRTEGSCCVESMERVFSVYLQARDFHSAEHMCFQYRGALNLMESLELFSPDEVSALWQKLFFRFLDSKYPAKRPKEEIKP